MTSRSVTDPSDLAAGFRQVLTEGAGLKAETLVDADDTTLQDLGLDSLATMEVQAIVETRYGVKIPDGAELMTVAQLSEFLAGELGVRS